MQTRRRVIATMAASAALIKISAARAQTIGKPARILVGFASGGSSDLTARLLAEGLKGYAPAVVVDNRTGAGGRLALEMLKAGPTDGSLMVLAPMSTVVVYPHTLKSLNYQPLTDFVAVTTVAEFPFVISVGPLVPTGVRTLTDFIAWCRANPKHALYSVTGTGTTLHLIGMMLARSANFAFDHVPYNSAPAAQQDVLGGRVAANVGVLGSALPQIQGGGLRALATSGAQRSEFLPAVPTFREAGFSELVASEWQGVFVPARTPAGIVESLNAAIRDAMTGDGVKAGLNKLAFEIKTNTPTEFAALMQSDTARWAEIVKASGLKPQE